MHDLRAAPFFSLVLLLWAAGCSTTRQIQTAPPRAAVSPDTTTTPAPARLSVMLETGRTVLPEGIASMRFRVSEVHLKRADGDWASYPSDGTFYEIAADQGVPKLVLSTQVAPVAYDSLALALSDIFVLYDANAGGPLTLPRDTPLVLPLTAHMAVGRHTTLRLLFEPGASLSRDARCRWYFLPFFETIIE
ncbi:MAG: hypothetical protein ACE5G0_13015 [Rhodothermales bacterium]